MLRQHAELLLPELFAITSLTNVCSLVALGSERSLLDFSRRITVAGMQLRFYKSLMCSLNLSINLCTKKYLQKFVFLKTHSSPLPAWERYSGWLMPTCLFQEPKAESSSCLNKDVSTARKRWMLYLCVFISFNLRGLPLWIKNQEDWRCLIDCRPPKAWQGRVFGRNLLKPCLSATVAWEIEKWMRSHKNCCWVHSM